MATEIYQEGLRIPPMKLYEAGRLRDDVLDMIALNIRNPRDFRGDLAAMVGAAHLGERRLTKLFSEFDAATVNQAIEDILDASERQSRAIVASWKDGVFHGEALLDDDGHGREDIRIKAKVTKRGGDIEVDLTGSDPQTTSFVNSSHANMQAAVAMAFAYLIDPDIPKNSGALRPLKVIAKQGTIVWADPGLPVTLCTSHPSNEIVEAIIKAMSASCPERAMGGWGRRFRIAIQGEDPRTGRGFIWHMFHARPGGGASAGGDGWSSIGEWHTVGGIKFGSVEIAEVRFPLHFAQHEFRADSGGKGQYRGGLGVNLDLVVEVARPARGNTAGDGARHGACGMLGGEDGLPHDYRLIASGKPERILKTKEVGIAISPGDVLQVRSGGGGGWGDPRKRSADAKRRDLEQGLISSASSGAH
jgi:N-methylhydantoinase B